MAELKLETVEDFEKVAENLYFTVDVEERYPKYWEQRTEFLVKLDQFIKSRQISISDRQKLEKMRTEIHERYSGG